MQDDHLPAASHGRPEFDADDLAIIRALEDVSVAYDARERVRQRLRALAVSPQHPSGSQVQAVPVGSVALDVRPWMTRRRVLAAAAAAGLSGVAFMLMRSRPASRSQLTAHCIEQLDAISVQSPAWQTEPAGAISRLEPLMLYVSQPLNLVGVLEQPAGNLSDGCELWKFSTTKGKDFYVFDFRSARVIRGLTGSLQFISQSSDSWSLAALQRGDQLVVAAVKRDIQDYFKSIPTA